MEIKEIKQLFFAHRNGITADALRKGGSGFRTIFGVELPPLSTLARSIGYDAELAGALWEDREVRESRLLSYWLMDPEALTRQECLELAAGVRDREDAQMLAFRVLKRRADAAEILADLDADPQLAMAAAALRQHLS